MFTNRVRIALTPILAGIGVAVLISSAAGQNPNELLNKAKADQAIITQKLESKMREAIAEARRLQETSRIRAVNKLKDAITQLDDPLIPPSFRNDWTAKLQGQIKAIETGQKVVDPPAENPARREIKEADAKRVKAIQDEYNDVRRSIDTIATLHKAGSATQAQMEAEALAKRYPNNPATLIMNENISMGQRITDARTVIAQQQQGYLLAMRSIDKSNIPIKGDVEFDAKRFQEITELRKGKRLTTKEQQIMKALDSPITIGFKDAPFDEVLKAISTATGQNILIEKSALQEAMIDSNTLVSIAGRGIAARTALRQVLQNNQLTFIIKDETIQVVTLARAREMLVTRVYYMGDLVRVNGPFGNALAWGPFMEMAQMKDNVDKIIEMVKSIDPQSWKELGGNGTVTFNCPSMSLVVRQTAEVHARLSGLAGR